MGNPKWSYDDMVREADRIITIDDGKIIKDERNGK